MEASTTWPAATSLLPSNFPPKGKKQNKHQGLQVGAEAVQELLHSLRTGRQHAVAQLVVGKGSAAHQPGKLVPANCQLLQQGGICSRGCSSRPEHLQIIALNIVFWVSCLRLAIIFGLKFSTGHTQLLQRKMQLPA